MNDDATEAERSALVWKLMNSDSLGGPYGPGERRSLTGTEANNVADLVFGPPRDAFGQLQVEHTALVDELASTLDLDAGVQDALRQAGYADERGDTR